jgi:ABC-type transporter Mla MlaB component
MMMHDTLSMKPMSPEPPAPHTVQIRGPLLVQRARDVARELRDALHDHEHVRCDLSGVEAIDVMGLQLLLSARVSQRAKGRSLTYLAPSAPVRALCTAFGLNLEDS